MRSRLLPLKRQADSEYGWLVVGFGAVILLVAGDTLIASFGAMLHAEPLGASRPTLVWTISSAGQASTLLLPLAGLAVDRFGSRRMAQAGMALCGAVCVAAAALPDALAPVTLYPVLLIGVLVGTNTPVMAALNQWFHDRRAVAIAVTLFAVFAVELMVSKTVALPAVRATILALGALVLVLGLPAATMLHTPASRVQRDDHGDVAVSGSHHEWNDGETTVNYGWREVVRTREFWLLVVGAATVAAADQLTRTLIFPLADYRFHVQGSYEMFENAHEIVSVPFVLVGGIISTRSGLRSALMAFAALHVGALAIVLIANGVGWLYAGILIMAAGHGGGIALTIAAVGTYFGRRRFATLLGTHGLAAGALQGVLFGLLFAIHPWLNYMDLSIDPTWALAAGLVPAALGTAAYWKLGDPKPSPSQIAAETGG